MVSAAKSESAISGQQQLLHLPCTKKERTYKLVLWNVSFKRWAYEPYLLYYAILHNNNTATCDVINYELNHTAELLVMDEEQCHKGQAKRWNMRPPRGVREKEDYRNSQAGHDINLEIEDVLDKIK